MRAVMRMADGIERQPAVSAARACSTSASVLCIKEMVQTAVICCLLAGAGKT
jgi:hypothetical protein